MPAEWPPFSWEETHETYTPPMSSAERKIPVTQSVPPFIAEAPVPRLGKAAREAAEEAAKSMSSLPAENFAGGTLEGLLLRTEAVNSSRIEGYRTSVRNLCLAEAGVKSKPGAAETLRNFSALQAMLDVQPAVITSRTVLSDHRTIMEGKEHAGKIREVYVQIGGADLSDAVAYPPPARYVPELLEDVLAFVNRQDVGIVEKCALGHSQFEWVHPFEDGNGRTGRALTQRLLLSAGLSPLPVSAGLYAMKDRYFESFKAYEAGDLDFPVEVHSYAFLAAAEAMRTHLGERNELISDWAERLQTEMSSKTALARSLKWLSSNPAFTVRRMSQGLNVTLRTAQNVLAKLEAASVVSRSGQLFPSDSNGGLRRSTVWECQEIYALAEQVEQSTRRHASASQPFSYDSEIRLSDDQNAILDLLSAILSDTDMSVLGSKEIEMLAYPHKKKEKLYRQKAEELLDCGMIAGKVSQDGNGFSVADPAITLTGRKLLARLENGGRSAAEKGRTSNAAADRD